MGITIDEELNNKSNVFIKNIESHMDYKSEIASILNNLEWLEKIEYAIPYLDNIIRNPKVALISESEVQEIEKAKKIGVESVKDLTKHTNYIESIDEKTKDVKPSKILVLFREETYNTYENRTVYTLIHDLSMFVLQKENQLKHLNTQKDKELLYVSKTNNGVDKITMELKITAEEYNLEKNKTETKLQREINKVKKRLKKVRRLITIWQKSDMIKSLDKSHVPFVIPPLRKTNLTLKNPNYKEATKLFLYLRNLVKDINEDKSDYLLTGGNRTLINLLNDTFLENYYILDSISTSKKEQKNLITKYALILLSQQVSRIVDILLKNGVKVTDSELLGLINYNKDNKNEDIIGINEVKKKFKKEIDDYLSKIQEGL